MSQPWSPAAQNLRRAELAAYIRARFRPLLDDQARSEHLLWWDQSRIAIWSTHAFLLGDPQDVAFGNTILRYTRDVIAEPPNPNPFLPSSLAGVLACHGDRLDADVAAWALDTIAAVLPFGMTRDFIFHGYNDNMPVMWTWALAYGGDHLRNPRYTELAWANLRQLRDMLRRRGAPSEYGQGYGTHRLTDMAHLATHGPSAEFRDLALEVEARLWAEIAGHWSPALAQVCGPSMRGGWAWNHETSSLLRQVFGDEICLPAAPWTSVYTDYPAAYAREVGLDPAEYLMCYPFAYGAEFSAAEYHVPDQVAALFYDKPPGFTFRCTAENGYVNEGVFCVKREIPGLAGLAKGLELTSQVVEIPHYPQFGSQPHGLTTYHGRNFALGTATTNQFGTSHAFRCTYRRSEAPTAVSDYGDVFVRYNVNAKVPGGRTRNLYRKSPDYSDENENYGTLYYDRGRHHCLQYGPTALCLQVPNWVEYWDVCDLRTDLVLWQERGEVGEMWLGDQRVDSRPFEAPATDLITINEGATYLAFLPLLGRHLQRRCALRVWENDQQLLLSLYNYEGPSCALSARDMAKLGNGFVCEVRDAADYPSFAAFQAEMRQARVLDQLYGGVRSVHYARPDLRLSLVVCPYANTVMSRAVNGLEYALPQLDYDGAVPDLPFLDGAPAVGFADWDWLVTQTERDPETYNPVD